MVTHESVEECVAKVFEHNQLAVFDAVNASTVEKKRAVENYLMGMCIVRCHGELTLVQLFGEIQRRLREEREKKVATVADRKAMCLYLVMEVNRS